MDTLLPVLAQNGLAGVLVGVVVLLHFHNVKVVIPKLLEAAEAERKQAQGFYRDELKAERMQHDKHITAVLQRLERIEIVLARRRRKRRPPEEKR